MARDPDRILEDAEALLHNLRAAGKSTELFPETRQKDLLKEISQLRDDLKAVEREERQRQQLQERRNQLYHERRKEFEERGERMIRIYILEAGEKPMITSMQDADLAVQFTNNIGMWRGAMRTEARMLKNRWGETGPVEIIENKAT